MNKHVHTIIWLFKIQTHYSITDTLKQDIRLLQNKKMENCCKFEGKSLLGKKRNERRREEGEGGGTGRGG